MAAPFNPFSFFFFFPHLELRWHFITLSDRGWGGVGRGEAEGGGRVPNYHITYE